MRYNPRQLDSILQDASQATVRIECRDLDSARSLRYALARRRGRAGDIIIRLDGRMVIVEPNVDPIISVKVS